MSAADKEEITILDVEHFPIRRNWYFVYPSGKQLSIVASTYMDYLLDAVKQLDKETK